MCSRNHKLLYGPCKHSIWHIAWITKASYGNFALQVLHNFAVGNFFISGISGYWCSDLTIKNDLLLEYSRKKCEHMNNDAFITLIKTLFQNCDIAFSLLSNNNINGNKTKVCMKCTYNKTNAENKTAVKMIV